MQLKCRKVRAKNYKKYYYCSKCKKEITLDKCNNCKYKEYKEHKPLKATTTLKAKTKLKQRTSKQAKLERERFSIFTDNMNKCYLCPSKYEVHPHEIFGGARKQISMRYGTIIPLCNLCHSKYQNDADFNDRWHKKGQKACMKHYKMSKEEFRDIFGKNYL